MAETKNRVQFWRGTSESYDFLKSKGALSYWTRYSVKYTNKQGLVTWKEFYGDNPLTEENGQLLPVIDIVQTLPKIMNPGDRYWVSDEGENYIVQVTVGNNNSLSSNIKELPVGVSVRVKSKGYKSYLLVDGAIVTYDEVDCGLYDE